MKVAHVTTVDLSLRFLLLNQLRTIRGAGYEVCGISASGPHVPTVEAAGVKHFAVPLTRSVTPLDDLRSLVALYRLMRRERFTVVHTHTPKAGLLGQYAALLARVPVRVHTIHGLYFPGHMDPRKRWAFVLLERITMAFSARNFSQNPEDVTVAIREGISAADKIECIGNGIDVRAFDPALYSEERRNAIRASFGLRPEHVVIGTVGRLVAEKGYLEMLEAARALKRESPNVRFLFVGESADFKKDAISPDVLQQMGLADVAQFTGHRTDVVDMYAAMDVFAHPSHREGFPRAPMEAACMALPAVVSDERGCRQTVEDGVTGYLVPIRDARALTERLGELVRDEALRRRLGQNARRKAISSFDERDVFAKILRAYARLLGDGAPRDAQSGEAAASSLAATE